MQKLTTQIMAYAAQFSDGTALSAKALLHLGNRAAIDQALSRLCERGDLVRAGRGIYLVAVKGQFGSHSPTVEQAIEAVAQQRGEIIVSNGAAAANSLGLSSQVPIRYIYYTSGRSRTMTIGSQTVELQHVSRWKLVLANKPAGVAVRALSWLGPERAEEALPRIKRKLCTESFNELVAASPQLPSWLASILGKSAHC